MICAAHPGPRRHLCLQPLIWPLGKNHYKEKSSIDVSPVSCKSPWTPSALVFSPVQGGCCESLTQLHSADHHVNKLHIFYLIDCHEQTYMGDKPPNSWFHVWSHVEPLTTSIQLWLYLGITWGTLKNIVASCTPKD